MKLTPQARFFKTANAIIIVYSTIKGVEYALATYKSLQTNKQIDAFIQYLDSREPIGFKPRREVIQEVLDDKASDIDGTDGKA